jgi:hypothetical protein
MDVPKGLAPARLLSQEVFDRVHCGPSKPCSRVSVLVRRRLSNSAHVHLHIQCDPDLDQKLAHYLLSDIGRSFIARLRATQREDSRIFSFQEWLKLSQLGFRQLYIGKPIRIVEDEIGNLIGLDRRVGFSAQILFID